jgi:hypothetical protein
MPATGAASVTMTSQQTASLFNNKAIMRQRSGRVARLRIIRNDGAIGLTIGITIGSTIGSASL